MGRVNFEGEDEIMGRLEDILRASNVNVKAVNELIGHIIELRVKDKLENTLIEKEGLLKLDYESYKKSLAEALIEDSNNRIRENNESYKREIEDKKKQLEELEGKVIELETNLKMEEYNNNKAEKTLERINSLKVNNDRLLKENIELRSKIIKMEEKLQGIKVESNIEVENSLKEENIKLKEETEDLKNKLNELNGIQEHLDKVRDGKLRFNTKIDTKRIIDLYLQGIGTTRISNIINKDLGDNTISGQAIVLRLKKIGLYGNRDNWTADSLNDEQREYIKRHNITL